MKTIEIDDSVYGLLLAKFQDFGDTPNSILRKEFGLEPSVNPSVTRENTSFQDFLVSTEFRFSKGVVGRFLKILSWAQKEKGEAFSVVENIKGRGRLYFSKDVDELKSSGKSVNPKKIPDSPYWVITTTPTDLKQDMLSKAMSLLDFDPTTIQEAKNALAH